MASSYLLSLLARQLALLGERFDARYPHDWLVWESTAGVRPADPTEADEGSTKVPTGVTHLRPTVGDSVCFPIGPERQVTVGRASTNSIAIEDMSMSREHFLLFLEGKTWHLALAEPVTCATFVRHMSVEAGKPVFLVDGCRITAGDVQLTFHERAGFLERVRDEAKRQEATAAT